MATIDTNTMSDLAAWPIETLLAELARAGAFLNPRGIHYRERLERELARRRI